MNIAQPIYTEKNNCQDCYKCIRYCPVKAIKIANDCASVIDDLCIACGKCVEVCPVGAKKVRSDIDAIKMLIRKGDKVILSLAPSWVSSFQGVDSQAMVSALKELGFFTVSETALGAEMVNRHTRKFLCKNDAGVVISSACPVIVDLINRHYPQSSSKILPALSPLMAHAKYLKECYGKEVHVVFAGPCIAKKRESDRSPELVDACITFRELMDWMEEEWVNFEKPISNNSFFEPVEAVSGSIYPVDGGMISGINKDNSLSDVQFMSFCGIDAVKQVLMDIEQWNSPSKVFVELMACTGGCINGPGAINQGSMAFRQNQVLNLTKQKQTSIGSGKELVSSIDITGSVETLFATPKRQYSISEITDALRSAGKLSSKDELNCGGCGYDSCKEFAIAMLDGKAERNMCISYMRRVAHDKATVLLQRMPSGVIIVDESLKVVECNQSAARMLGQEIQLIYDANPGMAGANLTKMLPFHKLFSMVLSTGRDILDRDVKGNGNMLKVSIFTIQAHKTVCAIMRDLSNPDVRSDEIVVRTKSVIKENLETVQQIAYLLGENASRTETMLNSIMELYKENHANND